MSTIAKIFIVLNFVLSIFFVGVASTLLYKADQYKKKYTEEVSDHKKTRETKDAEVASLKTELGTAQTSVDSATRSKDEVTRERDSLKKERADLDTARAQLQNTVDGFEKTLKNLESNLKAAADANENFKKQMDEAVAAGNAAADKQAEAEAEVVRKEDALKDGQAQLEALQKQLVDADESIKHHENMLAMLKDRGVDLNSLMAPPSINGVVQRVVPDLRIAILSVGKDDGVQPGFNFKIFRGGEFIGEGIVQDVYQDNASIRVMRTAPGKSVQVNDQATTRL